MTLALLPPRGTVAAFLAEGGYAATTERGYLRTMSAVFDYLGSSDPRRLTPEVVAAYLDRFASRSTQVYVLSVLRAYLRHAASAGVAVPNLTTLRRRKGPQRLARWLTDEQQRALIGAASRQPDDFLASRDSTLVWLLVFGLRLAEALDLTVADVRRQDGVPTITIEHGKGGKQRQVTFAEAGYRAVVHYRRAVLPIADRQGRERLLVSARGLPLSRRAAQYAVARLGAAIGLDGLHPHTLRHSYGTRLARAAVPLPAIQASMGHASLMTTSVYLHADRGWVNAAVAVDPLMDDER